QEQKGCQQGYKLFTNYYHYAKTLPLHFGYFGTFVNRVRNPDTVLKYMLKLQEFYAKQHSETMLSIYLCTKNIQTYIQMARSKQFKKLRWIWLENSQEVNYIKSVKEFIYIQNIENNGG